MKLVPPLAHACKPHAGASSTVTHSPEAAIPLLLSPSFVSTHVTPRAHGAFIAMATPPTGTAFSLEHVCPYSAHPAE